VQTAAKCEKSLMPNVFCSQVCEREFFRTALASVSLQDCSRVYGRLAQAARAVLNLVGIAFALNYYLHTDEGTRIFASVVLVCAGLFLVILDGVIALMANFNLNEL